MLLAVDIGNTDTVVGVFADGAEEPQRVWRARTGTDLATEIMRSSIIKFVRSSVIASVVPNRTEYWVAFAMQQFGSDVQIVDAESVQGMIEVALDSPSEAGGDRLANAVAARERYGTPVVVVDFGTATNLDVVGPRGTYLGGVISPGLEASASALFAHAARLGEVELVIPEGALGRSTTTAIQSGLMYGEAAKIEGLVAMIRTEMDADDMVVVATGGLAPQIAPLCPSIEYVDENLTLRGLSLIAMANRR